MVRGLRHLRSERGLRQSLLRAVVVRDCWALLQSPEALASNGDIELVAEQKPPPPPGAAAADHPGGGLAAGLSCLGRV